MMLESTEPNANFYVYKYVSSLQKSTIETMHTQSKTVLLYNNKNIYLYDFKL